MGWAAFVTADAVWRRFRISQDRLVARPIRVSPWHPLAFWPCPRNAAAHRRHGDASTHELYTSIHAAPAARPRLRLCRSA